MRHRCVWVFLVVLLWGASAFAQSSSNFTMDRVTVTSAAEPSSSANFAMTLTLAQEGPVGSISRCNDSLVQGTGFWSIFGETPVPVFLQVARDVADPTHPALSWSGSSSEFTLYRSQLAQGVVDPPNSILVTASCSTVDTPPVAAITFYLVLPTGN